jgi:hypothetical protein
MITDLLPLRKLTYYLSNCFVYIQLKLILLKNILIKFVHINQIYILHYLHVHLYDKPFLHKRKESMPDPLRTKLNLLEISCKHLALRILCSGI